MSMVIKLGSSELDLSKLTVIIGPNLSGKSAILKCIYSSVSAPASEKFNLGSYISSSVVKLLISFKNDSIGNCLSSIEYISVGIISA